MNVKPSPEQECLYLLMYARGPSGSIGEPVRAETILQKTVYAISVGLQYLQFGFYPHRYGAYSDVLAGALEQAIESKMIEDKAGALCLTSGGLDAAGRMWDAAPEDARSLIGRAKEYFGRMSYDECIAYSYSQYPETAANSEIVQKFNETRLECAISLFARKMATVSLAASIAGLGHNEFVRELSARNIPAYRVDMKSYERIKETLQNII